jgi:hypothetical protein
MSDDDDTTGDKPLIDIIKEKEYLLAAFRTARFDIEYAKYKAGKPIDQQFILRCGADILDNPES